MKLMELYSLLNTIAQYLESSPEIIWFVPLNFMRNMNIQSYQSGDVIFSFSPIFLIIYQFWLLAFHALENDEWLGGRHGKIWNIIYR